MKRVVSAVISILMTAMLVFGGFVVAEAKPDKDDDKKVTICHVPPGNPSNAHTITISKNALGAHLAHGDYEGACAPAPQPTNSPEPTVKPEPKPTKTPEPKNDAPKAPSSETKCSVDKCEKVTYDSSGNVIDRKVELFPVDVKEEGL